MLQTASFRFHWVLWSSLVLLLLAPYLPCPYFPSVYSSTSIGIVWMIWKALTLSHTMRKTWADVSCRNSSSNSATTAVCSTFFLLFLLFHAHIIIFCVGSDEINFHSCAGRTFFASAAASSVLPMFHVCYCHKFLRSFPGELCCEPRQMQIKSPHIRSTSICIYCSRNSDIFPSSNKFQPPQWERFLLQSWTSVTWMKQNPKNPWNLIHFVFNAHSIISHISPQQPNKWNAAHTKKQQKDMKFLNFPMRISLSCNLH